MYIFHVRIAAGSFDFSLESRTVGSHEISQLTWMLDRLCCLTVVIYDEYE